MGVLILNATIITVNKERETLYNSGIYILEDRIIDIDSSENLLKKYPNTNKIIDAQNKFIFPGFINTHNHLFQTLLKGIGDDMDLHKWLTEMMFPAAKFLEEKDTYAAAMLGCMEGLHSGVTTMVDYMHTHNRPGLTDGIVQAYKDLGIRGIIGRGCMDVGTQFGSPEELMESVEDVKKDLERLFKKYHNSENGRIQIAAAPSSMWSNSREMLKMLWETVNKYDSSFAVHISETPFARIATEKVHGKTDIDLLEDLGIIGNKVLAVHCVHVTDEDIELLKRNNIKVSHNVISNMYLASGVAPIPKMLKEGLNVSLGLDGAASNNAQDMLELMKITALQQKVENKDPLAMTAETVLEMATIEGAKCLNMENEIGSIEVGKKADLVIFNPYRSQKSIPLHNPVSTLVYSSSMNNIETVIIDGNIVLENGVIISNISEDEIIFLAQEAADKLCQRGHVKNKGIGHSWNSLIQR